MESPISCQNPDLDSELIRLCIRALEKLGYIWIGLIISKKKMHIQVKQMDIYQFRLDYKQWRVLYDARILIWTQNWSDSASEFWKSRIISQAAWSFRTKLLIQVKLMDISHRESCIMSESWSGLRIDQTLHPNFGKVGLPWNGLDHLKKSIFK